jgi:glucosamine--fructose-6-phosphate aminotransferase (isomerizing)
VTVAERMRDAGHPTVAVTCRAASPLATAADVTLVSPAGDEAAIVMTRSFASMLALLLGVVADIGRERGATADLLRVAGCWGDASAAALVGRRLGGTDWSRVVVLGGGPSFGIAAEWGLKLTETSQVPASAYEPLEFRHGPISLCEPGMLVVGLVGGPGALEEVAVVEEAAALGATTWLIARDQDEARGTTGELSLIGGGLHPTARLPLLLHPGHALALELALTRGLDPDSPRHLDQVVILGPG